MGDALKLIIIIIIKKKKKNPSTIRLESIPIKFPSWEIVENRGKKKKAENLLLEKPLSNNNNNNKKWAMKDKIC